MNNVKKMFSMVLFCVIVLCGNVDAATVLPDWTLIGKTSNLPDSFSQRHQDKEFNVEWLLGGKDVSRIGKWEGDSFTLDNGPNSILVKGTKSGVFAEENKGFNVMYVSVKAGPGFALYQMNNGPVSFGKWNTADLGNKDMSHMSFWSNSPPSEVPIPAGFLLFGSGIVVLIGHRRK